jgi:hypothetical protein
MLDGASRTLALADHRRDLGVAEPLDEAQQHNLTLIFAQLIEGGHQLGRIVTRDELGFGSVARRRAFEIV